MGKQYSALQIAKLSGYFIVPGKRIGQIVSRGFVLEVGPRADPDKVVTIACRRALAKRGEPVRESEVRASVEGYGYQYKPPVSSLIAPARAPRKIAAPPLRQQKI